MEEEYLTVFQIGSEVGISVATANKYFKRFKAFIPHKKEGRSTLYSLEGLKRFKLIKKLLDQKKNLDKVESSLVRKFPEEALEHEKNLEKKVSQKAAPRPLIKRVEALEKAFDKSKEKKTVEKPDKKLLEKVEKLEKEVERLRKLIEG